MDLLQRDPNFFFFWQPLAGLITNHPTVRHSNPATPLLQAFICGECFGFQVVEAQHRQVIPISDRTAQTHNFDKGGISGMSKSVQNLDSEKKRRQ